MAYRAKHTAANPTTRFALATARMLPPAIVDRSLAAGLTLEFLSPGFLLL
jgi:hypothetical protein